MRGICDSFIIYLCLMKHISIIILKGATLNSIDATRQLFLRVNDLLNDSGRDPKFVVELVGADQEAQLNNGIYTIKCDRLITDLQYTDLIMLPLICGNIDAAIKDNEAFYSWIIEQYKEGAEVASLCIGAYVLAATGLLEGKECAIHWASLNDFKSRFPNIKVLSNRIITDQDGIYTSGGTFSYLNLILYLIEKYVDRETSILVSKMFEIEIERDTQAPYVIFVGQKNHDDVEIKKAQEYIEQNYGDKITVNFLADRYAMGRRSFERRFKKATNNSFIEYLQRVKIEAVKKGLESSKKTINDLMYEVGYSDVKAFRDLFKKITGLTPVHYKEKYGKKMTTSDRFE